MAPNELLNLLHKSNDIEFYFGPQGFALAESVDALLQSQVGYSIDPLGAPITGEAEGDWRNEWVVIGKDTELGDPYFLDISQQALPVYTAFPTESGWEIEAVAKSLNSFLGCLSQLKNTGRQTQAIFVPDVQSITSSEALTELKATLITCSECPAFWTKFMDSYIDWLEDEVNAE